jgi:hypothetical protein
VLDARAMFLACREFSPGPWGAPECFRRQSRQFAAAEWNGDGAEAVFCRSGVGGGMQRLARLLLSKG